MIKARAEIDEIENRKSKRMKLVLKVQHKIQDEHVTCNLAELSLSPGGALYVP